MPVTLQRMIETAHGTLGQFRLADGATLYTMERMSTGEHPRIPAGLYELKLGMYYAGDGLGGKADYPAYEILGVPGRTNIKIHVANRAVELLGCVAPGKALGFLQGQLAVLQSLPAFRKFMDSLAGATQDYITITDAPA